jgi:glutamate/tyrosine decarboxylase-like PLP-dependent enzyme
MSIVWGSCVRVGLLVLDSYSANITAMWMARNKALAANASNGCRGVDKEGIVSAMAAYGYKGSVIIGSQLLHYSFRKAADLIGLGESGLCLIPADETYCMKTDILAEKISEYKGKGYLIVAVVGIAGTTETGSIDRLKKIADICERNSIHFHVDAAWGGPLIFSPDHSHKLAGIALADSITVDGHKQLYTPMGVGVLLLKSPTLALHIQKTANYIIRNASPDLGKFTLEGSRPANALYLHASISLLGADGLSVLTTRSCTLMTQLYVRITSHPAQCFQAIHEPQSNIMLYRYIPHCMRDILQNETYIHSTQDTETLNEFVVAIQKQQASSEHFVSRTKVHFKGTWVDAFRVVVANPLTQWSDIEACLAAQIDIGLAIEREMDDELRRKRLMMAYAPDLEGYWPGWPFDI